VVEFAHLFNSRARHPTGRSWGKGSDPQARYTPASAPCVGLPMRYKLNVKRARPDHSACGLSRREAEAEECACPQARRCQTRRPRGIAGVNGHGRTEVTKHSSASA
jgi:hypothetical protein